MSATPASRAIASLTALKSRSRSKTSVTSLMRSMKTNERILRNESCSACSTREEEDADALVTRRRDVAQHEDLRPPRAAAGGSLQLHRDAAGLAATRASCGARRRARGACARALLALRLQPALELRDDAVHARRGPGAGPVGSARSSSFSGRAGGSASVRSICARSSSRRSSCLEAADRVAREAVAARVVLGEVGLRLGAQAERAADALDVDADDARALALAAEGRDRQPREVAHRALVAVAQRLRRSAGAASRGRARAPAASRCRRPRVDALADRRAPRRRGRRSGRRRGRRRAGPRATSRASPRAPRGSRSGSVHGTSRAPRTRRAARDGPDRDALAAQLLAELEQVRGEAVRASAGAARRRARPTAGRGRGTRRRASRRRARRRCRGRCGA